MDPSLQLYKELVDGLAQLHRGVHRHWIESGWPDLPDAGEVRSLLAKLSAEEKGLLIRLLESARDGGIHDTLVHLNHRMAIDGLRLKQGSVELPHQPFDTQFYYDWMSRREGQRWPDDQDKA